MTTVALVDDHHLVREAVARAMDTEPDLEVVGQAGSVTEGLALVARGGADVFVVDVSLADGSGLDVARAAREASDATGIVVLTMHSDDDTLLSALDAGASALVLKSASLDHVVDAVRRAAADPQVFSAAGLAAALRRRNSPDRPHLTPRQREVLVLLKEGLSVSQVAKKLYMSESTVKTHVAKMYEKLGATNRAQALMAAIKHGLLDAP